MGFFRKESREEREEAHEQWLKSFMAIYQQATPLIGKVAQLNSDGQPADLLSLVEAYRRFRPLLQSLKKLPKPPEKELRNIKNDFEKTLSMCVKAGEMAMKMSDDLAHGAHFASRLHLASIVGYIGYAEGYHKASLDRLTKIGVDLGGEE
jgi:hypothetical protein